jgi:hypothetical protein
MHDRGVRQSPPARGWWWSVTTTSIPASRARDLLGTAVIPQSR